MTGPGGCCPVCDDSTVVSYAAGAVPCPIIGAPDACMVQLWRYFPTSGGHRGGWVQVAQYLADDQTAGKDAARLMYDAVRASLDPSHAAGFAWYGELRPDTRPGRPPEDTHPVAADPAVAAVVEALHPIAWQAVEAARLTALEGP